MKRITVRRRTTAAGKGDLLSDEAINSTGREAHIVAEAGVSFDPSGRIGLTNLI
jgi:hypothetical protein